MRSGQQNNKRGRGRSNNNSNNNNNGNNRKHANPLSRSYDSTGPDVKVRGTAQHVAEKYMTLARDAHSAGDRVMAENYLQHAEHYNRIIAVGQAQMQERQQRDDAVREQQQQQQLQQQERDAENEPTIDANADAKEAVETKDVSQGENTDGVSAEDRNARKPQPRRRNNPRPRRPRVQDTSAAETSGDIAPIASTTEVEAPQAAAPEIQAQAAETPASPAPKVSRSKATAAKKTEVSSDAVKPTEAPTPAE